MNMHLYNWSPQEINILTLIICLSFVDVLVSKCWVLKVEFEGQADKTEHQS